MFADVHAGFLRLLNTDTSHGLPSPFKFGSISLLLGWGSKFVAGLFVLGERCVRLIQNEVEVFAPHPPTPSPREFDQRLISVTERIRSN